MPKCDIEGCSWEGHQLAVHKSKAHGIHATLNNTRFGNGIDKDFISLKEVIEKIGNHLTFDQLRQLNLLIARTVVEKHEELLRKREEEDALFEKMRSLINNRDGPR